MLDGVVRIKHLHHEGGFPTDQIVARTDAGEELIDDGDGGFLGGDEGAYLSHDGGDCELAHVGGFTAHVRSCNEQDVRFIIHHDVIGDEGIVTEDLHDRMEAASYVDFTVVSQRGTREVV